MNIKTATERYEQWLTDQQKLDLIPADLKLKHQRMAASPFEFLRATFYRWAQVWRDANEDFTRAPAVLAVGDLHVENFGTWQDASGHHIWGVNDFDEAAEMPYTNDLVRLATSARLALEHADLDTTFDDACDAIRDGYTRGIEDDTPRPFDLSEKPGWLRDLAATLRDRQSEERFEERLNDPEKAKPYDGPLPPRAAALLARDFPDAKDDYVLKRRVAGLGSLGRLRVVRIQKVSGRRRVREVKALATSSWHWANGDEHESALRYSEVLRGAVRALDPSQHAEDRWVVRRLAPDADKIDLDLFPDNRLDNLFRAMGRETANIHWNSASRAPVLDDLKRRREADPNWLRHAAGKMARKTRDDFEEWRDHWSD